MKSTLRIPTKQQYAYIEVEFDGKPQEIVDMYFDVSQRYWEKQVAHDREKRSVDIPFEGDEYAKS